MNTGVPAAEGGFETPLGRFDAKWSFDKDLDGNDILIVQVTTPLGTDGVVRLPDDMLGSYVRDGVARTLVLQGPVEVKLQGGSQKLTWNTDPFT